MADESVPLLLATARLARQLGHVDDASLRLLGFTSPVALRNQMKRYTDLVTSDVRETGAVETLARQFERAIAIAQDGG